MGQSDIVYDMGTPGSSRLRRFSKWSALTLFGLVLLALILLLGASLVRRSALEENQGKLGKNIARVSAEICGGHDIPTWFRERVRGTNGWAHLRDIDNSLRGGSFDPLTPVSAQESGVHWALSELNDWKNGYWQPHSWDKDDQAAPTPSPERFSRWLNETDVVAAAFARAASCDVVAPDVDFMGSRVRDWAVAANGMLGRNRVLRDRGSFQLANAELKHLASVWTKLKYPTNVMDYRFGLVLAGNVFAFAEDLLVRGDLSAEEARFISELEFDCEAWLPAAVTGEAAWIAGNAMKAAWISRDPSLLGWLTRPETSNEGLFDNDKFVNDVGYTISARYAAPINLTHEINLAIDAAFKALQSLDGEVLPPPERMNWHQPSLFGMAPSRVYSCAIAGARLRMKQQSLLLRVLQVEGGQLLVEQKSAVEALVRRFRYVGVAWEDNVVVLNINPELVGWMHQAQEAERGMTTEDSGELFRSMTGEEPYSRRVEPISDTRKRAEASAE